MPEEQRAKPTFEARMDAITMNLELAIHDSAARSHELTLLKARMDQLTLIVQMDAENIRQMGDNIRLLVSVAGAHEERIATLERPPQN